MKSIFVFFLLIIPTYSFAFSGAPFCPSSFDKDSIEFNFVGYKFTAKTPVKGTFKKYDFKVNEKNGSISELIKSLSFSIDAASIDTGLEPRNKTIFDNVFKVLMGGAKITGRVLDLDDKSGVMNIEVSMNGVTQKVPMALKLEEKSDNEAIVSGVGSIDMLNFKMNKSYENISKACKALHTGPDGVSKTWTEVGLTMKSKVKFNCKK